MRATLLLVPALLLAAGCVAPSADDLAPASADPAQVLATLDSLLAGVPCEAQAVAEDKTSENLKPIAQLAYGSEGTRGEIDIADGWMLTARYAEGGFELSSVHDPTRPVKVATYQSEPKSAYDVKWLPDNRTAIVGHDATIEIVDVSAIVGSGMTPDELEAANITPVLVSTWTYPVPATATPPSNMHMLTAARIAEKDYVFVAPNDNTGVWVLEVQGEGMERKLVPVGQVGALPLGGGPLGPHDMSLVWDQFLGKPVLYVANGFEGWGAYDVSDPKNPEMLALMPNVGPAQGYTHTVLGQKVGDRRIVAMMQEVGSNWLTIYDATDFRAPILLAQWQATHAMPLSPQHNLQLVDGKLYMGHYTHGVYVFDLAKLDALPLVGTATLAPMARFVPSQPGADGPMAFDNVWDVVVHQGLLYVNDVRLGTSVVGFGCLKPGPDGFSSAN